MLLMAFLVGCTASGNVVKLPIKEEGRPPDVYFCPRQNCSSTVLGLMENAQNSLHCAFYELNLKEIINALSEKSESIDVGLVTDGDYALNLSFETNDGKRTAFMHNKFCVIDGSIVLTGSFNPIKNAETENDENILIIHDPDVAKKYLEEFKLLYGYG